jgi:heme oxygenase
VRAERGGIVAAILAGTATRAGYALWLRNLLPVYQEMEQALARLRDHPGIDFLAQTALHRAGRIAADLDAIAVPVRALTLLPHGERYARRVARAGDERLVAHAYTRYLGDLSGGRALRRRLLNLFGSEFPVSFSAFPEIADIGGFVAAFRAALDGFGRQAVDPDGVVKEAAVAFAMNIRLSEAILPARLT